LLWQQLRNENEKKRDCQSLNIILNKHPQVFYYVKYVFGGREDIGHEPS
jgi:hypothetical protein